MTKKKSVLYNHNVFVTRDIKDNPNFTADMKLISVPLEWYETLIQTYCYKTRILKLENDDLQEYITFLNDRKLKKEDDLK